MSGYLSAVLLSIWYDLSVQLLSKIINTQLITKRLMYVTHGVKSIKSHF